MKNRDNLRLAIIGGGQLGMLLFDASRKLGINTLVVTSDRLAPALHRAEQTIVSDYQSDGLAERIAHEADVVTFEFEAVPVRLLEDLEKCQLAGKLEVRPPVPLLRLLQNKATQKLWLREHGFPTLEFIATAQPADFIDDIQAQLGLPVVQKAQQGGYDGYGVQIIESEDKLNELWDTPSILEVHAGPAVEIGVVVARSPSGEVVSYPPVRMDFVADKNVLDAVVYPAGLDTDLSAQAVELARAVVAELDGTGVFAVEMFLLANNQLTINEVSPRVHNSGHHTLDCFSVSQFEQHVRAVTGLPLLEPRPLSDRAVMRNLLYSDALEFMLGSEPQVYLSEDKATCLYWYGKTQGRDGRKMGHVTCLGVDPEEAESRMQKLIKELREAARGAAA